MTNTDKVQSLRHEVRHQVVGYAKEHPESFSAHMTAAAVVWLLAGRPGLTHGQQVALLSDALVPVTMLAEENEGEVELASAVDNLRAAIAEVQARGMRESPVMREHADDFAAWAEQLEVEDS